VKVGSAAWMVARRTGEELARTVRWRSQQLSTMGALGAPVDLRQNLECLWRNAWQDWCLWADALGSDEWELLVGIEVPPVPPGAIDPGDLVDLVDEDPLPPGYVYDARPGMVVGPKPWIGADPVVFVASSHKRAAHKAWAHYQNTKRESTKRWH